MDSTYPLGVGLAMLGGAMGALGLLFQKKSVNEVPLNQRGKGFMGKLAWKPLWLTGMVFQYGLSGACILLAVKFVGPALVPGLQAIGLVFLALGSVYMNHESLNKLEMAGIPIMIVGVFLLGISELGIDQDETLDFLADKAALIRIALFTVICLFLWAVSHFGSYKAGKRRVTIMALSTGIPAGLTYFWMSPMIVTMFKVLPGDGTLVQAVIMVAAALLVLMNSILAAWQMQAAFKYGQASNIVPVQGVTLQTIPVIVYFGVYALSPPKPESVYYVSIGVSLIILAGFLLGRRQAASLDKPADTAALAKDQAASSPDP
jgi:drug/metabolite transporter (DMT)-like permease